MEKWKGFCNDRQATPDHVAELDARLASVSKAIQEMRTADNSKRQATTTTAPHIAMKEALCLFFSADPEVTEEPNVLTRVPRSPFDLQDSTTHRDGKLVYILRNKFTHRNLSMKHLKTKDAAVAANLRAFCDESSGAFELFLAKVVHTVRVPREEDKRKPSETVLLECEWLPCSSASEQEQPVIHCARIGVKASLEAEVVPFTSDENYVAVSSGEYDETKAFSSAALVLIPSWMRIALQFSADAVETLENVWLPLVDTQPIMAKLAASAFGRFSSDWMSSRVYNAALQGVSRLGCIASLHGLLQSCQRFKYTPALGEIVKQFSWAEVAALVNAQVYSERFEYQFVKRRVACLLASCLRDDSDPDFIRLLVRSSFLVQDGRWSRSVLVGVDEEDSIEFSHTDVYDANAYSYEFGGWFARLLEIVVRRAPDLLESLLWAVTLPQLVREVCPALRRALTDGMPPEARAVIGSFATELEMLAPAVFQLPFASQHVECPKNPSNWYPGFGHVKQELSCATCRAMRNFLTSAKSKKIHVEAVYASTHVLGGWLTVTPSTDHNDEVVIEKSYQSALYMMLMDELERLVQLLM